MWVVDAFGYTGGFLGAIRFIPQIKKTIQSKSSNDLSYGMLYLSLLSQISTTIYVSLIRAIPLLIPVTISTCMTFILITLKCKYDNYEKHFKPLKESNQVFDEDLDI